MMMRMFVICLAVFGLAASNPTLITTPPPNLCPQPTESDPAPPSFLYGHPEDCTKFFTCAHGQPTELTCSPGTKWSNFFETCAGTDTIYDTCTRENAVRECDNGSTGLIPHPTACQRYYNCSDTAPRYFRSHFERYEDECPYPDYFDIMEKKCKSFKEATCGPLRRGSKDACDYLRNRCGSAHCRPCRTYPTCLGLENGRQEDRTRKWTPYFVICDTERILGVDTCERHQPTNTTGFFHPVEKKCVSIWEVPRDTGYGLAPNCTAKSPGNYRTDERPDVYYTCPGAKVSFCPPGSVLDEDSGQCE